MIFYKQTNKHNIHVPWVKDISTAIYFSCENNTLSINYTCVIDLN